MIELGRKKVGGGFIQSMGGRSSASSGSFGQVIALRGAPVNVNDVLMQDLRAPLGITTWSFDLRGKGQSMAFDLRRSQSITQNMSSGVGMPLTTRETNGILGTRASVKDELAPVGLVLTYEREAIRLDAVVLPAVIEG